jgi:FKBP-type peptidyl-prolyl cis-trans isomerase
MGQVIAGWDESVIDMSIGEVAKIHCTPDYAYGMSPKKLYKSGLLVSVLLFTNRVSLYSLFPIAIPNV